MILILDLKSFEKSGKNESYYAHLLLDYGLKKYFGIEGYELSYGKNKKPYLKGNPLYFNLSHTKDKAVCAFSKREVGCDVENIGEYKKRIAKRFFTENEFRLLEESENPETDFFRLWVLKESALKKSGEGITAGLSTVDFSENLRKNSFKNYNSYFTVFSLEGAFLSVCAEEEETELIEVKAEDLKNFLKSI